MVYQVDRGWGMKNIPKEIWLQVGDCESCNDFNKLSEVTWYTDKINDNDIKYILSTENE